LAYWWLTAKKKAHIQKSEIKAQNKKSAVVEPQKMVSCSYCDLHLPEGDAIGHDGRYYCCANHRDGLSRKGWWGKARWRASPNFDERPQGVEIDLLVIHHISLPPGQFGGSHILDFFQNNLDAKWHPYFEQIAHQKVSSHFLIDRKGQLIQLVSVQKRAWHAGASQFFGRERCNDFAIGVELEGDGESPFTNEQYTALAELLQFLEHDFPKIQLAGHSDIAPDRKTDPGKSFDWVRLQRLANLNQQKLPFGTEAR
jgi:AmpD protein